MKTKDMIFSGVGISVAIVAIFIVALRQPWWIAVTVLVIAILLWNVPSIKAALLWYKEMRRKAKMVWVKPRFFW